MAAVRRAFAGVGWWIFPVLLLEAVALSLNALGWRLSFPPVAARSYGFMELARLWLSMDGINYFIPSGTLGGEVARATMLNDSQPSEVRTASVVCSRIGQTIAQTVFVLLGIVLLVSDVPAVAALRWIVPAAWAALAVFIGGAAAYLFLIRRRKARPEAAGEVGGRWRWLSTLSRHLSGYLGSHPGRFGAAILVFAAAYAWRAVEAWCLCRLIGVPVSAVIAMTIEVLSSAIDGIFAWMPAKIGSQELGKTSIFALLGLPPGAGFAFGVLRHVREIVWAALGLLNLALPRPAGTPRASR